MTRKQKNERDAWLYLKGRIEESGPGWYFLCLMCEMDSSMQGKIDGFIKAMRNPAFVGSYGMGPMRYEKHIPASPDMEYNRILRLAFVNRMIHELEAANV